MCACVQTENDGCDDVCKRRAADAMMQILIEEEEAEKMHKIFLEKHLLEREKEARRKRLKSLSNAARKRAARSSTATSCSRQQAQENVETLHLHASPRSETRTEQRQDEWAGCDDGPFDIFLKLFDGTTKTLRNVRSLFLIGPLQSVFIFS